MTANSSDLFQLDLIREREMLDYEADMVNMWSHVITLATQEAAAEAACLIDQSCPPCEDCEDNEQAKEFVWLLWDIMLAIASSPNVSSEIQDCLVSVLFELKKIDRGVVPLDLGRQHMWIDFPDLAIALRAHNDDPTFDPVEPITEQSVQRWLKFNEFEARLMESGVAEAFLDAMWVLERALEEGLPAPTEESAEGPAADCRLLAASIWISRCAKNFYEWARENADPDTTPQGTYEFRGGPLYSGRPTMCPERWDLWQHRLEELGAPDSGLSPQAQEAVQRALESMRTVTAGVGSAESS